MKVLFVVILAVVLQACASVPQRKVDVIWERVAAGYENCKDENRPRVLWLDRDIYILREGREVFVNGAYSPGSNTVYLREWWADEDTVAHEFRHACGDMQEEVKGRIVFM